MHLTAKDDDVGELHLDLSGPSEDPAIKFGNSVPASQEPAQGIVELSQRMIRPDGSQDFGVAIVESEIESLECGPRTIETRIGCLYKAVARFDTEAMITPFDHWSTFVKSITSILQWSSGTLRAERAFFAAVEWFDLDPRDLVSFST